MGGLPNHRRLYKFFLRDTGAGGESFTLCDAHVSKQKVPDHVRMIRVAESSSWPCDICQEIAQTKAKGLTSRHE